MFNLFNKKKKKTKSNLFSFVFLKKRINPKKLLIIFSFALIVVGTSIFSAYSFPGSSGGVVIDDNYVIVAFTDVGPHTWTVPEGVTSVDVLVVGGGGGGGITYGAGGGAGGLIYKSNYNISGKNQINLKVGGGGSGTSNTSPRDYGDDGEDSEFDDLIAKGGGAGGHFAGLNGKIGGSGGGASSNRSSEGNIGNEIQTIQSGYSGIYGYGNNGGSAVGNGTNAGSGGGGGAGEPGYNGIINGSILNGGKGGDGLYFGDIFGEEYGENGWFAGGGGGGSRSHTVGLGGKGGGATYPNNALNNTGGGGAGDDHSHSSTSGGSGIVLIRYRVGSNLQISSLNSGLVGHWTLDQDKYNPNTGRVTDNTPYSNHGTNYGATFTTDRFGNEGGAMSFNGAIYDYINLGKTGKVNDTLTVSAWAKINDNDSNIGFIVKGDTGTWQNNEYIFGRLVANELRFQINDHLGWPDGENNILTISLNDVIEGEWHHYTMIADGLVFAVYLDGELYDFIPQTIEDIGGNKNRDLLIGVRHSSAETTLDGEIDDVRIYDRALSQEEISQLYNSYKPKITPSLQKGLVLDMPLTSTYTKSSTPGSEIMTDRTPYSNDGQNIGATITSEGADFNGSSDYINVGTGNGELDTAENWSWSFWTKKEGTTSGLRGIIARTDSNNTYSIRDNSGVMQLRIFGRETISSGIQISQEWEHWTLTKSGNNYNWYNNGKLITSYTSSHNIISTGNDPLYIGFYDGYSYFRGMISNIMIYNRALSAEEVELLYARGR